MWIYFQTIPILYIHRICNSDTAISSLPLLYCTQATYCASLFPPSYEFVKYLRQYVESSLGAVVEKGIESRGKGDEPGVGHDTLVHAVTGSTRESEE